MKNNYLDVKKEDGKIVVSSSDGVFSSIITLDNKEAFKNYCERKAKEWRESILGNYDDWSDEDRKRKSDKWINAKNFKCGKYNFYFNIEDNKDIFRKEVGSLAKSLGITDYILEVKEVDLENYNKVKKLLSLSFMNFLDNNRTKDKMCLSNGECFDIEKAFDEFDFAKLFRYMEKYLKTQKGE